MYIKLSRRQTLKLATLVAMSGTRMPAGAVSRPGPHALYRQRSRAVEERVRDLLARMTPAEKVAQLIALWATKADVMDGLEFSPAKATSAYPNSFGQVTRPSDKRGAPGIGNAAGGTAARWRTPEETVEFINAVQRWAVEDTRLGIPVLFHEESLHGYMATDATMFPQAIALAGTFDTDLMEAISRIIAREVRARGVPLVLSPVVDIVRDPRWGRIEETFGEDPCLVGEMGVAAVTGLQGDSDESLADEHVFATLKHMTGHGQPDAGNNVAPAPIAQRELREHFFPPFREVIRRTAIRSVMPSYNEIDGIPSHKNTWLLRDMLRAEWGFDGIIVSDYEGISQLESLHHVTADIQSAAGAALEAGVDCDLPDGLAYRTLEQQLETGAADMALIDEAVSRVLALKFRAGLFENPRGDLDRTIRITGNDEARRLALTAARKSLCLLTNDGTLPLDANAVGRIAVVGPNADVTRLGGYSSVPRQSVSLLEGIRGILGDHADLVFARGVHITRSEDRSADEIVLADEASNARLINEAVDVAAGADVIVLAIGDTEQTSREGFAPNHLGDRTDIDLVGQQNALFDALRALGKPVVVCAINGRPPSWPNVAEHANALLECWYAGQEGGTAMAEALFGQVNPGAKLPVTVARDVGFIPRYYNHKPSARRGYLFSDNQDLFPFGHGLSYTRFEIGSPRPSRHRIRAGDDVHVEVDVTNRGDRVGDEVVQLYVRDEVASVTRPVKQLRAFERVTLEPGETKTCSFVLGTEAFSLWNPEMIEVVEAGTFTLMAGPDSVNLRSATLEIINTAPVGRST